MAEENISLTLKAEAFKRIITGYIPNPEKIIDYLSEKDKHSSNFSNNTDMAEDIEKRIMQINLTKRGISKEIREFAKHAGPEEQKAFASEMFNLKGRSLHNISIETEISENMGANNIDTLIAMGGKVRADHPKAHLYTPEAALKRAIKRSNVEQINMLSEAGVKVKITSRDVLDTFEASKSKKETFQLVEKQLVPAITKNFVARHALIKRENGETSIRKPAINSQDTIKAADNYLLQINKLVTSVINNVDIEKTGLKPEEISVINNIDAGESRQPKEALASLINKLDSQELANLSRVNNGKSAGDDMLDWAIKNSELKLMNTLLDKEVASKTPDKFITLALDVHNEAADNYSKLIEEIGTTIHHAVAIAGEKKNKASQIANDLVAKSDIKEIANKKTVDWAIKNKSLKTMERILEHDSNLISEAMNKPWPIKATKENKAFFDKVKAVTPDIYKVNSLGKTAVDTNPDFFTTKERIVNFGLKIVGGLREGVNKSRNEAVKVNISKVAQRMQTEPHKREQQQEKNLNHTRDRDTQIARPRPPENEVSINSSSVTTQFTGRGGGRN